jgi:hypothetical protein
MQHVYKENFLLAKYITLIAGVIIFYAIAYVDTNLQKLIQNIHNLTAGILDPAGIPYMGHIVQ